MIVLYLTYDEFRDQTGIDIYETAFDKLLQKASAVLDNVTNRFYQKHDIERDSEWRVRQFKKALCAQIEYFHEMGATTFEGINRAPQSFTAGRTSVSNASRYNPGGKNEAKPLVAEDVYLYLAGAGLLYAGVSSC